MAQTLKILVITALGATGAAFADPFSDPHLNFIPRTAEEAARIAAVTQPPADFSTASPFEERSAGAATVRARANTDAFSQASGNIPFADELTFKVGNGLFRKLWVSSPSSTLASDGLGPLFNARSCQRCHLKDGRGHPPEPGDNNAISMLMRVSIPGDYVAATAELTRTIWTAMVFRGDLISSGPKSSINTCWGVSGRKLAHPRSASNRRMPLQATLEYLRPSTQMAPAHAASMGCRANRAGQRAHLFPA